MDPDLLETSLERAASEFSWENVAAETLAIYNEIFQLPRIFRSQSPSATFYGQNT
jgi:hypothetical protein